MTIPQINWNRLELNDNYSKVPFEEINSKHQNKLIISTAQIIEMNEPETLLEKIIYICKHCKNEFTYQQPLRKTEINNFQCEWCGHKGVYEHKKTFKDVQELTIGYPYSNKKITLILEGDLISFDKYKLYDTINFKGCVIPQQKNKKTQLVIYCKNIFIKSRLESFSEQKETVERDSPEYQAWVKTIQNRDKVCQICGGIKHLEVHHLYGYADYPELRIDLGNGVVLCKFCHSKFHSYYGKTDVTPAKLINFIHQFK